MRRLLSSRPSRLEWRDVAFRRQRRDRQTNTIVYIVAGGISSLCARVSVRFGFPASAVSREISDGIF